MARRRDLGAAPTERNGTTPIRTLETFAEFAAAARPDQLSGPEREILARHLLDTLGAAIAGTRTPVGAALRALQVQEAGRSAVLSPGTLDDIVVRTATVRHTECDDIHTASNVTPSAVIVPTALTLCGRLGVDDPATVAGALIAGYEAITRLGRVIDGPSVVYKGIWPTFFCAAFGAAAVAGRLSGHSPERTAQALAIALTTCTGGAGRPTPGHPARWLVVGQAARSGAACALAASAGFTADPALLDGDYLAQAHGIAAQPEAMTAGLGDDSIVAELSMKPFCTAKQATAAIAAFQELLAEGIDPEAATAIDVHVPDRYRAMIDRPIEPGVVLSSFGNLRYQFGLSAFHPEGLYDAARTELFEDPRLAELAPKISVHADAGLEAHMPRHWPARVDVRSPAGDASRTVVAAPGDPECRFGDEAVRAKVHRMADPLIGPRAAEDWIDAAATALFDRTGLERLLAGYEDLFVP